jgi:hypothetical protein
MVIILRIKLAEFLKARRAGDIDLNQLTTDDVNSCKIDPPLLKRSLKGGANLQIALIQGTFLGAAPGIKIVQLLSLSMDSQDGPEWFSIQEQDPLVSFRSFGEIALGDNPVFAAVGRLRDEFIPLGVLF